MYNHESPRRADQFVTKKIISAAVKIKAGLQNKLYLGNLDVKRDWGYAPDFVKAMWKILQQDKAEDFIIATSKLHSLRDFLDITFSYLGLDYTEYVKVDQKYFRTGEKNYLCGNPYKINNTEFSIAPIQNWIDNNVFIEENEYSSYTSNAVAIWIRNTNKWPAKNISPHIYNSVFDYCINNKKTCYVFQDLIPIKLPNNDYIIDSTIRFKQRPDFDSFIDICNKCDYFIGADSGPIHLLNVLKTSNRNICLSDHRLFKNIIITNNPIDIINNYYKN